MKEKTLIDTAIEIDYKLFKRLDKRIKEDQTIPEEEKALWNSVHLYPETLSKKLVTFLKEEYGSEKKMRENCLHCGSKNIVWVEYDYTSPKRYDGVSEMDCLDCGKRFGRWCERELQGKEQENRFCKGEDH